jgi:hypothetical protein
MCMRSSPASAYGLALVAVEPQNEAVVSALHRILLAPTRKGAITDARF